MLAQRGPHAAPAIQAVAQALPLHDAAFDAATIIFSLHHWPDAAAGLSEVRRVTRGPIVILTWDVEKFIGSFWMVQDYVPEVEANDAELVTVSQLVDMVAPCRVETVPVPHDCTDGFFAAYWRRPEMYLDPRARAAISALALLEPAVVERMERELRADLESGEWHRRHANLLELDAYDNGYRLIVTE